MDRKTGTFVMCAILLVFMAWIPSLRAEPSLQYQNRGNRYEGVKPKPVSGYDIELISVRAAYTEQTRRVPDTFKLRFYLNRAAEVYLTVRELDYKYYYWLDKVKPKFWTRGFQNEFVWPAQEVIRQLDQLGMYDLGVVARLEREQPSKAEQVAPVILYHSQLPKTIRDYLFTLKTNGDARLTCSIYKEGDKEPVFTQTFRRQRGGRPFTLKWDSATASEGFYRLVVKGYFLHNNVPINQTVDFYHQPKVKGTP